MASSNLLAIVRLSPATARRVLPALAAAVVLPGCTMTEHDIALDIEGPVSFFWVDGDNSDITLRGRSTADGLSGTATSWGRAGKCDVAAERESGNRIDTIRNDAEVGLTLTSANANAGVDLDLRVPAVLDLELIVDSGRVWVEDITGVHTIHADGLTSNYLAGDLDAVVGGGGVDVELWPYEDCVVRIDANGPVTLALPAYGPYALDIDAGIDGVITLAELGFDELTLGEGWVQATRFPATCSIVIETQGDDVTILEAR